MRLVAGFVAVIVVVGFAAPALAQEAPPPQPSPGPAPQPSPGPAPQPSPGPAPQQIPSSLRKVVPGRMLAGIEIGDRIQQVLTRFGRPSEIRETTVDSVYLFNRFGIAVYVSGGIVTAVSTSNSLLKIDETLGVGYRAEDVFSALGRGFREGTVEGFPGLIYDNLGIAFGLDRQAVAVIIVFKPGTATSISAFLPGAGMAPSIAGFPSVAGLRPWSAEANYLSLPGYMRWVVFQASTIWITFAEASRVVVEQRTMAH